MTPKRGDRFVHARFLNPGAVLADVKADPGNEAHYQVRTVTAVRGGRVYHRAGDAGSADSWFAAGDETRSVRRWIGEREA